MVVDQSLGNQGDSEATPTDVVRLTLPQGEFVNVARIVVGGLAARNDLSYESLDDLQLAVETILEEPGYGSGNEITLEVMIGSGQVDVLIGPVNDEALRAILQETDAIGLRVVLGAVVDSFAFEERTGEPWIRLEKRVPPPAKRA